MEITKSLTGKTVSVVHRTSEGFTLPHTGEVEWTEFGLRGQVIGVGLSIPRFGRKVVFTPDITKIH